MRHCNNFLAVCKANTFNYNAYSGPEFVIAIYCQNRCMIKNLKTGSFYLGVIISFKFLLILYGPGYSLIHNIRKCNNVDNAKCYLKGPIHDCLPHNIKLDILICFLRKVRLHLSQEIDRKLVSWVSDACKFTCQSKLYNSEWADSIPQLFVKDCMHIHR